MLRIVVLISAAGLLSLAGCASPTLQARHVLVEKGSGVVAIPISSRSYEERARGRAVDLIRDKCGPVYTITREEEVAVADIEEVTVKNELAFNSSKTIVRGKKLEYRLTYVCR